RRERDRADHVRPGCSRADSPGLYTWRARVVPAAPRSYTPVPTEEFELRALVPVPHVLTLKARYQTKAKSVLLTGKLTSQGQPEAGKKISFSAFTGEADDFAFFGPVTTNSAG